MRTMRRVRDLSIHRPEHPSNNNHNADDNTDNNPPPSRSALGAVLRAALATLPKCLDPSTPLCHVSSKTQEEPRDAGAGSVGSQRAGGHEGSAGSWGGMWGSASTTPFSWGFSSPCRGQDEEPRDHGVALVSASEPRRVGHGKLPDE